MTLLETNTLDASNSNQQRAQQLFRLEKVKKSWQEFLHRDDKQHSSPSNTIDNDELWLCLLQLDRSAIQYLIEEWHVFRDRREQGQVTSKTRELRKLVLYECNFVDESAVHCFLHYLQQIGSELREVGFSDAFLADEEDRVFDEASLVALTQGLQFKTSHVERLSLSHAFLSGNSIGKAFETLLSKESSITQLRLWGCKMDAVMFQGLVKGLAQHSRGVSQLSFSDCGMDDDKLCLLVNAVLGSPTKRTLSCLDLSKSKRVSEKSLPMLTHLVDGCTALQNLNLNECRRLCWDVEPSYESYLLFTQALSQAPSLQELGLCSCGISDRLAAPLFASLVQDPESGGGLRMRPTLRKLDVRGIDHVTEALADSLPLIKGLTYLCAHVNLESKKFRAALARNTSLVEFNCLMERLQEQNPVPNDDEIWLLCSDKQVCRILQRNRLLQKVPKLLQRYSDIDETLWPLCAQQLAMMETAVGRNSISSSSTGAKHFGSSSPLDLSGPWSQQTAASKTAFPDMSALLAFVEATSLNLASIYIPMKLR